MLLTRKAVEGRRTTSSKVIREARMKDGLSV